jgi:hypothetical protein
LPEERALTQTLPEALVHAIKELVRAHTEYTKQVEELSALGLNMRGQLDRLVSREGAKLVDVNLADHKPVALPRAIVPLPKEAEGAA